MKSFLDDLIIPPGCQLICHDANHNGDYGGTCGNPDCWKYNSGTSPAPKPIRCPGCKCPLGTFEDDQELRKDR